jgi:hypothetical protein
MTSVQLQRDFLPSLSANATAGVLVNRLCLPPPYFVRADSKGL